MAKIQQKSEKISAFGGIFFVLDKFDRVRQEPVPWLKDQSRGSLIRTSKLRYLWYKHLHRLPY